MEGKPALLALHRMGPLKARRRAVESLEEMFLTHAPEFHVVVHDADQPLSPSLRAIAWSGIVLGPTFLCSRYSPRRMAQVLRDYGWIAETGAVKIALPQDDYDCSQILDDWMVAWGMDFVVTVLPEHKEVLYPRYSTVGSLLPGFTGYISDSWVERWSSAWNERDRPIDVSYRSGRLPANFGSLGQLKSRIAETFIQALERAGASLTVDISTDPRSAIPGDAWHDFMSSSRFCLVTPSGSSLLDPDGTYRRSVARYHLLHPRASFEQVAQACFPGQDGRHQFQALSPRNLEAALAGTVQLAVPGSYSGVLNAGEHYVALAPDASNIEEVLATMRDPLVVSAVQRSAREAVLSEPGLRLALFAQSLAERVLEVGETRGLPRLGQSTIQDALEQSGHGDEGPANQSTISRRVLRSGARAAKALTTPTYWDAVRTSLDL